MLSHNYIAIYKENVKAHKKEKATSSTKVNKITEPIPNLVKITKSGSVSGTIKLLYSY